MTVVNTTNDRVLKVLEYLPCALSREIRRICEGRLGGMKEIREIRIRRSGRSTLKFKNETVPLFTEVTREGMENILSKLCEGSLYAYRDSIREGYISVSGGVRVGICGAVRYDGDGPSGARDISSFVFRIPGHECEFGDEICRVFKSGIEPGMLIYSPPGVGKTTALRDLAMRLGTGRDAIRVAVVDERREFCSEDYVGSQVDILSGYKKCEGLEIASRTLSPDVILIDEIGREEAESICGAVRCGIPIVATAHAGSLSELLSKVSLTSLFDSGVFGALVGITYSGGCYMLTVDRI